MAKEQLYPFNGHLTKSQKEWLQKEADKLGVSVANFHRRAIQSLMVKQVVNGKGGKK